MKHLLILIAVALSAQAGEYTWDIPKGFPKPVVPADNPMSVEKAELGRRLFYEKRISVNGQASCGTCHKQELAFTDGLAHARGTTGQQHPRSSMSLVNIAYSPVYTWANPNLTTLEEQALGPMLGEAPVELGLKGREEKFLDTLRRDAVYPKMFAAAFPGEPDPFTIANVTKAIACFERTIISMRSPYDRYRWNGETNAISESAKRGEILFASSEGGRCFRCHGGWNFGEIRYAGERPNDESPEGRFFNTAVTDYKEPNRGIFEYTKKPEDMGKFRPPTLRNIAITAPYMHDGSLPTLEAVIEHYAKGGTTNDAHKSPILQPLHLTDSQKHDLIEFLKTLTDDALLHDPRFSDPFPSR